MHGSCADVTSYRHAPTQLPLNPDRVKHDEVTRFLVSYTTDATTVLLLVIVYFWGPNGPRSRDACVPVRFKKLPPLDLIQPDKLQEPD